MSLLLRRRMLIAQQKKSSNLFDESLLTVKYDSQKPNTPPPKEPDVIKTDEGYEIVGYPIAYYGGKSNPLLVHLKSVLKPNTYYTIAREMVSTGPNSAGGINLMAGSTTLFSVGMGSSIKKASTFILTQEQIDAITTLYIYGTSLANLNNGANKTIYKYIQLVEGIYTADTLPPYEPYEE